MEAAAKLAEALSKDLNIRLPDQPLHLSRNLEWRYPDRRFAREAGEEPFPEWYRRGQGLQYTTFLSDADRGILFTRPDYDMYEEARAAPPREVNALARTGSGNTPGGTGGEKKKLSLSDYKNKKTISGVAATTPPASSPSLSQASKRDGERTVGGAGPPPRDRRPGLEAKRLPEVRKPEESRYRDGDLREVKQPKPRDSIPDTRLPPKPPSLPPKPPTPEKKRFHEDDQSRPQKRLRPDERPPPPRDDPTRRRDREPIYPPSSLRDRDREREREHDRERERERERDRDRDRDRDRNILKDSRGAKDLATNGRNVPKPSLGSSSRTSPTARSRGASINGVRPDTDAARSAPKRNDVSKSGVPPLLSPLRLDFDKDEDGRARSEKRRREDLDGTPKTKKKDNASSTIATAATKPVTIPPLLSPTLPPEVETELERRKKPLSEERQKEGRDLEELTKRLRDVSDSELDRRPKKRSLIVKLVLPKSLRNRFKGLMQISATQARKRPASLSDDATAAKRPRLSDVGGKLPAPSTPSKKNAAAMSRVSSQNSHANTPGETVSATPSSVPHSQPDRLPNGRPSHVDPQTLASLQSKSKKLERLAAQIKRSSDEVMRRGNAHGNGILKPSDVTHKLASVLNAESVISFMASFVATMSVASMTGELGEANKGWETLFPYLAERKRSARRWPPLHLLFCQLELFSIDQLLKTFCGAENIHIAEVSAGRFRKLARMRFDTIKEMKEADAQVKGDRYRLDVKEYTGLEEIGEKALKVLRRFGADESVGWNPEQWLGEEGIRKIEVVEREGKWVLKDS